MQDVYEQIESQMLNALISYNTIKQAKPSHLDMKYFIIKKIDYCPIKTKMFIGHIIAEYDNKNLLKSCCGGTLVNLDSLTDKILEQIYDIVFYKTEV